MMAERPEPLRICKSSIAPLVTAVDASLRFPPQVPSRSSSMKTNSRNASNSSTSTAITPPMDAGCERLEVRKIRSASVGGSRAGTKEASRVQRPSALVCDMHKHYYLSCDVISWTNRWACFSLQFTKTRLMQMRTSSNADSASYPNSFEPLTRDLEAKA